VDAHDIDEIVESHLKNGKVVERLLMPANVSRWVWRAFLSWTIALAEKSAAAASVFVCYCFL